MNIKWIILILVTAAVSTGCNEKETESNLETKPLNMTSEINVETNDNQAITSAPMAAEEGLSTANSEQKLMDAPGIAPENLDQEISRFVDHIASRQAAEIPTEEFKQHIKGVIQQIEAQNDI